MSEAQTIQWFPGHMTKTRRKIQASLKLVDAVLTRESLSAPGIRSCIKSSKISPGLS